MEGLRSRRGPSRGCECRESRRSLRWRRASVVEDQRCSEVKRMHGTHRVEPEVVNGLGILAPRQLNTPLSSLRIGRVLPSWLDALLKEVVVRVGVDERRRDDVVVETARSKGQLRGKDRVGRKTHLQNSSTLSKAITLTSASSQLLALSCSAVKRPGSAFCVLALDF